jgi:hypothetical protein
MPGIDDGAKGVTRPLRVLSQDHSPGQAPRTQRPDPGSCGSLDRYGSRPLNADNWSLLSELGWLSVTGDTGQEMDVAENGVAQIFGIENYFNSGRFGCVFRPHLFIAARWETLATSKYGDPVAGVIVPGQDANDGMIFVLAQGERRANLVAELVDRVLPTLVLRLFPHAQGGRWTRRPEYDLPRAGGLRNEIVQTEEANPYQGTRTRGADRS